MSYRCAYPIIFISILLIAGCSPAVKAPVRSLSNPEQTPEPTPRQTRTTNQSQAETTVATYQVKAGDTLYSIAFRYGLNYRGLAAKNGIRSPYRIHIGQQLLLSDEVPSYSEVINPDNRQITTQNSAKRQTESAKQATQQKSPPAPKATTDTVTTKPAAKQSASQSATGLYDKNIRVKQWLWPLANTKAYQRRSGNQLVFNVNKGTPVRAVAAGRVVYSGKGLVGYGHLVIIKHSQNLLSAYAFNDEVLVTEKQVVKAGQKISTVGASPTGEVGLGFEIRSRGKPVNPLNYLKR